MPVKIRSDVYQLQPRKNDPEHTHLAHAGIVVMAGIGTSPCHNQLWSEKSCTLLHLVVVDVPCGLVQSVGHRLEENGDGRNLLRVRLISMRQVTTMRQIQGHDAIMWLQQRCVDLKVGR